MGKGNRSNPAWNYATRDENNVSKFKCNFCSKVLNGGVFRVKEHLVGGLRNATGCPRCPAEVQEEIKNFMKNKKEIKEQNSTPIDIYEMVNLDDFVDDTSETAQSLLRVKANSSQGCAHGSNSKQPPIKVL